MLRALAPSLIVAMLVMGGAGLVDGLGGPAWIIYAAIVGSSSFYVGWGPALSLPATR